MIAHLLNASADVYRATLTPDGRGGHSRAFAQVGVVRVKVNQPSTEERLTASRLGAPLPNRVHTTVGADVERGDELDVGHARRLRVVAVVSNSRLTYKRLECEEVQGGD